VGLFCLFPPPKQLILNLIRFSLSVPAPYIRFGPSSLQQITSRPCFLLFPEQHLVYHASLTIERRLYQNSHQLHRHTLTFFFSYHGSHTTHRTLLLLLILFPPLCTCWIRTNLAWRDGWRGWRRGIFNVILYIIRPLIVVTDVCSTPYHTCDGYLCAFRIPRTPWLALRPGLN
jgi:hypothetical protein